ncbi:MAG: hypothetical protein V2I33_21515 [Kangiellaceae bacterium]|nr:hypothetical protein [Kangiellaceae bacterium]
MEYLNEAREAIQEIEKACKEAESDNMSIYMEGMVAESTLNDPE